MSPSSFVLPALATVFWLAFGVSCDHALGSLGGNLAFRMGPFARRMLVTTYVGVAVDSNNVTHKVFWHERMSLDVGLKDLDGSWEGLTKPMILFESLTSGTVCPEESTSCAKDIPIKFTLTISDGKYFKYRLEKDESATCPIPMLAATVEGTVTSYENKRLLLSYPKDFQFDFPAAVALKDVYGAEQTACLNMRVYEQDEKVKADVKVNLSFSGTFEEYEAYLKKKTSGFSVCEDEAWWTSCIIDFTDHSNVIMRTTQLVKLECVDGKCLNLLQQLGFK